jgi:hypothetical protein
MDARAAGWAVFAFQGLLSRSRPTSSPGARAAARATELLRLACRLERLPALLAHRRMASGDPAACGHQLETPVASDPLDRAFVVVVFDFRPVRFAEIAPAFLAVDRRLEHCGQFWATNVSAGKKVSLEGDGVVGARGQKIDR